MGRNKLHPTTRIFTPLYNATYRFSSLFSSVTPRSTASRVSPSFAAVGNAWCELHGIWQRMTDGPSHFIQSNTTAATDTTATTRHARPADGRKDRWTVFRLPGWPSRFTPLVKLWRGMHTNATLWMIPPHPLSPLLALWGNKN